MIVLGITDSFTSGAAIVVDGQVRAAVNEERIDRNKMCTGFPQKSIVDVLRIAALEASDVDAVAIATNHLFWRPTCLPYHDYFRDTKGGGRDFFLSLGSRFSKLAGNWTMARKTYHTLKKMLTRKRRKEAVRMLQGEFGFSCPIQFVDHHLCHAASAYFTSGYEDATIITMDGAGDGKCSRVYRVQKGEFDHLTDLESYDSVGNYYSYVTHLCGYKAHKHEGKITGLAAYGAPAYMDLLQRYVRWGNGRVANTGKCFDHSAIEKLEAELGPDFSHQDLSASVQNLLESSVVDFSQYWIKQSGMPHVAVAGGVFANVKLNQRIHEIEGVEGLFVHPGMGDDGLAVGAGLYIHNQRAGYQPSDVVQDVYWGGDFRPGDVEKAISDAGVQPTDLTEPIERAAARLLADGKVVERCDGRMEYGPRALGNRTIMYQTTDPTVNDWLNQRLARTEFMPFAPVTLWEHRSACYQNLEGAEETARFMTITFDCTDSMKKQSPAVCHVDGTARPQLIRERDNPSYYQILSEYHALTGIPSLINTSFNIHEEPIVYTPEQALVAFRQSKADALVLGDFLIEQPPAESD